MDETKMDFIGKQCLPKVCQQPSASVLRSSCADLNWSLQLFQVTGDHSLLSPTQQESISGGAPPTIVARLTAQRLESCSHKCTMGNPKVINVKNNEENPRYNAEQRALHLSKMLERNWNSSTLVLPRKLTHRGWETPVYEHTQFLGAQEKGSSFSSDSHKYVFTRNAQVGSHSKYFEELVSYMQRFSIEVLLGHLTSSFIAQKKEKNQAVCVEIFASRNRS